jgi:SNF2 family DNA or RNA helicase
MEDWSENLSSKLLALIKIYKHHSSASGQCHWVPPEDLVSNNAVHFSRAKDGGAVPEVTPRPPASLEELSGYPRLMQSSPGMDVKVYPGRYRCSTPGDPQRASKMIVYYNWSSFRPLISSALKLHGVYAAWVDGTTSMQARDQIFADFNGDKPHKADNGMPTNLLFISPIGGVGLNFQRANVILLLVGIILYCFVLKKRLII